MSEAPSQLLRDSTQLQKLAGVSAIIFSAAAMIMTAYWAHGPNTTEGYLGGLNWKENTFNWHPVLMVSGAIFCLITSLLSYRILPLPKTVQKTLHGIMHTAAFICMSVGLAAILQANNFKKQSSYDAYTSNFTTIHTYIGLGVYILYGLNYILGIAHYALPIFSLAMKKAYMHSHVFIGTFILFGSMAAVVSGLTVMTGSCVYPVSSADINPAENYHLLSPGCQLANSIGIVVVLAVFLCAYAIFRNGTTPPDKPDDKNVLVELSELLKQQKEMAAPDSKYPLTERMSSIDSHASALSHHDGNLNASHAADNRISMVDFWLTENEDVKERGNISREQLAHFVDLTYVATIFNINHLINACGDGHNDVVLLSVAFMFILFTTRYHFDIYSIMFYSIDLVHRCLFLMFNLGVFVMTLNIKFTHLEHTDDHAVDDPSVAPHADPVIESHEVHGYEAGYCLFNIAYLQGFASGYLASRLTLILMYSLLIHFARLNKEYNSLKTYVVKVVPLLIATIVMIPIYWESVNPLKILLSVAIIEILGDIVPEVLQHYLMKYHLNVFDFTISMRPNVDHLQDRLQEFFLIVLGESMIGLLINQFSVDTTQSTYLATLFSFTLMFSLGTHFLVCVHRSAEQVHAMKKKNALIRIIYIWLHPVVCYVLLITTNALVQLTEKITNSQSVLTMNSEERLKMEIAVGLSITVSLMIVMRTLHKGVAEHLVKTERIMHIVFKFAIALLHFLLYYIVQDSLYFILAESFLTTATNMVEMLIPLHTKSRGVDILHHPQTVDSTLAPGAQHELNANRKSVLQRTATKDLEYGQGHGALRRGTTANHTNNNSMSVEMKQHLNPLHTVQRTSNSSTSGDNGNNNNTSPRIMSVGRRDFVSINSGGGGSAAGSPTAAKTNTTTTATTTVNNNTAAIPTTTATVAATMEVEVDNNNIEHGVLEQIDV